MSAKIKVLKTNGISGLKIHEVGKNGVTEIKDNSIDAPENFVLQYLVYVNGKMKYSFENGAFEIEYED
jgi:hypothetical protein